MKPTRIMMPFVLVALALSIAGPAAFAQTTGPTAAFQTTFPVTVAAGDYTLVNVVLDFAPGAGIPNHTHPGPVVVDVLQGAITLHEEGGDRTFTAGQSWTETAGHVHSASNQGSTDTRVSVTALLPKGTELVNVVPGAPTGGTGPTTVTQEALPVTMAAGDYVLIDFALDFAPGAGIPNHTHPGPVAVTVAQGAITLHEPEGDKTVTAGQSWTENGGHVHSVVNMGSTTTRVIAGALIPKGTELVNLVQAPAGMPTTGDPASYALAVMGLLLALAFVALGLFGRRFARGR